MTRHSQRPARTRKHAILIQCEGLKTEPRYLQEFSIDCGATRRFAVTVKPGKGQTAAVTMRAAITEGSRQKFGVSVYDEVWCVLDVEHAAHEATLTEALAKQHGIKACLSNPSFEVWLLAHFARVTRSFEGRAAAERRLSEAHWRKHFGGGYDKADPRLYERLQSLGPAAIDNAAWTLATSPAGRPMRPRKFTKMGVKPLALATGMDSPMPFRRHDIQAARV